MIVGYEVARCRKCGAGREYLHFRRPAKQTATPCFVQCSMCASKGPSARNEKCAVEAWNLDNKNKRKKK